MDDVHPITSASDTPLHKLWGPSSLSQPLPAQFLTDFVLKYERENLGHKPDLHLMPNLLSFRREERRSREALGQLAKERS